MQKSAKGQKNKTAGNSMFSIGGFSCCLDCLMVDESSVVRINICSDRFTHRKATKRLDIQDMTTEFQQKRGLNFRRFILTSDKIIVETRTLRKNDKYEIKLDRIGLYTHYQSDNTIARKIFFGVCIALVVGSIFGIIYTANKDSNTWMFNAVLWFLMACFAYFKPHQDDIYLVGGQTNLVFYRDIPNEKKVFRLH